MLFSTVRLTTLVSLLSIGLLSVYAEEAPVARATNKALVAEWLADYRARQADNPDVMFRDGVAANRQTRRVEFFAETTGISPNEPMEFFLISEESGNGYEAFAVALARPRDIYDAMLFIGMPVGRGVDHEKLQFWPKGERVHMTIDGHRAESLVFDEERHGPMEASGLVFTGSRFVPSGEDTNSTSLAAQTRAPYSIAANYNEADSLFDVPFSASQSAVYSKQALNPEHVYPEGKRLPVVIAPEYRDGKQRIRNLRLHISAGNSSPPGLSTALITVENDSGTALTATPSLASALALFSQLNDDGHDPFVTLDFSDNTTIGQLHQLALLLQTIDGPRGVRIEPPPAGQLYYKAFAPNQEFRHRENRFLQPWELHLQAGAGGAVTGVVAEITENWIDGQTKPEIDVQDHAISSPEEVHNLLTTRRLDVKVLLVYAPATLTHAELMRYVEPLQSSHPVIHVYVDEEMRPSLADDE
jgi:hypothetical protein